MHPRTAPVLRGSVLITLSVAVAWISSCATPKKTSDTGDDAPPAEVSPTPTPAPTPSPTPSATPEPTPIAQTTFRVIVSNDEGQKEERVFADGVEDTPSPTPSDSAVVVVTVTPTPDAATPTPTPKQGNFLSNTWRKLFPPKKAPTPPAAQRKPQEGFLSRMWHSVFPKKEEPPVATSPSWIGTVKLVDENAHYVLVDTDTYHPLATGETLIAVGNERETATLRVTADRNPPFFIADIVSGRPMPGDRIYSPKPTVP